ncbi:MAG: hypothetical protein P3B76_09990, partial [Gemmatimonadota bacterium]|nr:hypothetical protein [Gemmatimonadota bacterium]
ATDAVLSHTPPLVADLLRSYNMLLDNALAVPGRNVMHEHALGTVLDEGDVIKCVMSTHLHRAP